MTSKLKIPGLIEFVPTSTSGRHKISPIYKLMKEGPLSNISRRDRSGARFTSVPLNITEQNDDVFLRARLSDVNGGKAKNKYTFLSPWKYNNNQASEDVEAGSF